ncbi:MAG: radical SAM protein [Clostridium sp.]
MSRVNIKCKSGNEYIFDNTLGVVIPGSATINYILDNIDEPKEKVIKELVSKFGKSEEEANNEYSYLEDLNNNGYFNQLHEINPTSTEIYSNVLKNSPGSQLILIVTEECNLRCKYCIYSDCYPDTKSYSNKKMSFEVAKQAIDRYFELYYEKCRHGLRDIPKISFYGGEPFLELELIKKIVEYCNEKYENIQYLVTTNGTIMSEEIANFLVENNFNVTFSLDGNRYEHDRNRVFANGSPSFDTVTQSSAILYESKLRYEKGNEIIPMSFACCFDKYTDMQNVINYFDSLKEKFGDFQLIINEVDKYDTSYYKDLKNDEGEEVFKNSIKRLKKIYIDGEIEGIENTLALKSLFKGLTYYKYRFQGYISPIGNACVVGDKIAVDPEGVFFICEKACQQYPIGDIEKGINIEKCVKLTNDFIEIRSKYCKECNISRLCDACYVHFMKGEELKYNEKYCNDKKEQTKRALELLYESLDCNENAFNLGS